MYFIRTRSGERCTVSRIGSLSEAEPWSVHCWFNDGSEAERRASCAEVYWFISDCERDKTCKVTRISY